MPQVIGDRYAVEREIGRGGMATVHLAEDRKHHRQVAVKLLDPELAAQVGAQRFLREIAIAARLTHPNILPLIDSGEATGSLYYVMPYVPGGSLRQRLTREHQLPVDDVIQLAQEVGAALDYAHREGFVHRDIKPDNILFADGHAVVTDFGIARAVSTGTPDVVTEPGFALGTPTYMSPEQASAEAHLDARSDVYSLACVLYEALAGEPPFTGPNTRAILARHVAEEPRLLRTLRPDTPVQLEQAIARALAKDPAHRFPSVADFVLGCASGFGVEGAMRRDASAHRSLAVLPFVNASPGPENEYLSDGITDELINALTKVERLRVASQTSVFALKGKAEDVRAIGARLNVALVLEGTVRRSGDRLRVTARLTAVDDGRHIWSERYDRKLGDVFAIQDDIARRIVDTVRNSFLSDVGGLTPRRYTENVEAYGLYLKGRFCWNKRSRQGTAEAIEYFEQAIEEDPTFALAYSGLADAHALQLDYRGMPVAEGFAHARKYAERALALDETLAEAHTSLGWVQLIYDWDWDGAAASFRRAIASNPRYATARQWYAFALVVRADLPRALAEGHAALELDPASVSIRRSLAFLYYYARQYEAGVQHMRRAVAMDPTSQETYRLLGMTLTQLGAYDEAEQAFREAVAIPEETAYAAAGLGYLYAVSGRRREAEKVLSDLRAQAGRRYVSPVAFQMVYLGLGDVDQSFEWLERAYADRRGWLAYLRVEPMQDPIRKDRRFAEWVQRMKL